MKQNRRNFLQLTGTASAGLLLSSFESFAAQPQPSVKANAGYELKIVATNWGFEGTMDAFCAKAKKEGYDGIEQWWPGTAAEQKEMFDAVKKHGLDLGIIWGADENSFAGHHSNFKVTTEAIAKQKIQKPVYINLHSGRDYFSVEENKKLIDYTTALSKETGIPIYHETHRGRMLFAAHITNDFIQKCPELKLTLDISHWCNVHESLLENQPDATAAALERTEHIHARIGYQEGPQVADPRAPEWKYAVDAHFAWWDKVVERKKKAGERITFLTEFGPPLYMQTLPYTLQPLSNQWEINVYMMQLLRKRYA
ncbi:MAG TPA: sugar phosphate isomerase/epimerase [Ferruginibacter sp.]|nr:sugar phosphate isomerase/epimerase [Ferruginibacter sp.]HMP20002.1 sugar phosphate isomerase/epimerase [Ferruginibacter sp.]